MGRSPKNVRGFVGAAFAMGLVCVFSAGNVHAANFNNKTLKGNYGCLGRASISGSGLSELIRLTFDGSGGVGGSVNLSTNGEQCNFSVSGSTYSVNSDGTGQVVLTWSAGAEDPDADVDCSILNGVSEHMGLVIEGNGKEFDFESLDPFLSGAAVTGTDPGDIPDPFVGSCKSQNK
jgi:hypothetical protein